MKISNFMQNIQHRQQVLLNILEKENLFGQEDIIQKLREKGVDATQATLSRDLKALGVVKIPGEGYKRQRPIGAETASAGINGGLRSLEFSGNMAVIKTDAGLASALAVKIDHRPMKPIMGTIAGDDTVLLIIRNGFAETDVTQALEAVFPNIGNLVVK